jgi:hypothetical protein
MKRKNPIRKKMRKENIQKINKEGDIVVTLLISIVLLIVIISIAARN